ncbi:MAG TPA: Nramp family divalent metal transporter [Thermomicrobiales bacterium]|nr:Nramp family divalent metal transporter [Thermomicrobiales bacterium]
MSHKTELTTRLRGLAPALRGMPVSIRDRARPALRRLRPRGRLALLLTLFGPGLVAAAAGNDAGGITTFTTVGATYGYRLLWALLLITISLVVVQEMSARLGAVTGKGLADLIREEFGVRWTVLAMVVLLVANGGTTIAEFAGISAALGLFGVPKWLAVPAMAVVVWLIVVRLSYRVAEKVFLALSAVFIVYLVAAVLTHPDWAAVARSTFIPQFQRGSGYIATLITLVGTTITPYMQLFLQSAVVDKGVTTEDYAEERTEVIVGSILSIVVSAAIVIACAATLHANGVTVETAADAAEALRPIAGEAATVLFGIGLFGASMLAASILPLATSYAVSEAFGFERGISRSFGEAPVFFGLYTAMIVVGAAVVLLPVDPIGVILLSQLIDGLLLPVVLVFILLLINNRGVMGRYTNTAAFNVIAWATTAALIALTAVLFASGLFPGLLGG